MFLQAKQVNVVFNVRACFEKLGIAAMSAVPNGSRSGKFYVTKFWYRPFLWVDDVTIGDHFYRYPICF